jgi:hypothetical protein
MNEPLHSPRLFDRWRSRGVEEAPSEPADLGTAFGLELSMLPDEETAATETTGAPGGTLWWRRLLGATSR